MKDDGPSTDTWAEYRRLILHELERLNNHYTSIDNKMDDLKKEVNTLKVKASVWGAIAGFIVTAITGLIIHLLTNQVIVERVIFPLIL